MFKKRLNKLKRKLVTVLSLAMILSSFPVVPCEAEEVLEPITQNGAEIFLGEINSANCVTDLKGYSNYYFFKNNSNIYGNFLIYDGYDGVYEVYDEDDEQRIYSNSDNKIAIYPERYYSSINVSSASHWGATGCAQFMENSAGEKTYIEFNTTVDCDVVVATEYSGYDQKVYLKEISKDSETSIVRSAVIPESKLVSFEVAANKTCRVYADSETILYYINVMPKKDSWDFTTQNALGIFGNKVSGKKVYIDGLYVDVTGSSNSLNRVGNAGVEFCGTMYVPIRDGKVMYISGSYRNLYINDEIIDGENTAINEEIIKNGKSDKDGYVKICSKREGQCIIEKISWIDNNCVEVPTAKTGLVYTGTEQVGVEKSPVYTLYTNEYDLNGAAPAIIAKFPGKYYAMAKLNEGCTWSDGSKDDKVINWSIDKAPLIITANDKTITYGDELSNDGVSYSGFVNNEDSSVLGGTLSYAYTYEQNNDAGEYLITPSGLTSDNYDITFVSGKLTVQKKDITNTEITAPSAKTLTYNGSPQELVTAGSAKENGVEVGTIFYAVTTGGTEPEESDFTTSVPERTNVGDYHVWYKFAGDDNHNDTGINSVDVSIAKPENNNINVSMEGWTYGDEQTSPEVTGLGYATADITYSNKEDGTYTTEKPLTPGTWYVKASVAETDNYPAGEAVDDFEITKRNITITADSDSKAYDGTALTKDSYTCSVNGLAPGDKIDKITVTGSQTAVGSSNNVPSEAVIKNSDNTDVTNCYNITYANGTLTVAKRPLQITAVAKSKKFGESDPELTYTSEGLVENDKITGTLTRTAGENPGTYAITQGTLAAGDNYEISFVGADLTIEKADSISGAPEASKSVDYTVDTVGKVELPDNWTWKMADINKELTVGAAVEATAEYTGSDKDNYADTAKYVTVSITRNACTHDNLEDKSEVPASCTKEGILAHSKCPVCNKLFVKVDDKLVEKTADELKIEAVGHSYGKATYSWSDDHATCTATKVCMREDCDENSEGHVVTETVKTTSKTTPAGCEEKGVITYTATFTDKDFGTVTDSVDIAAKNHDYVITYEWSEDGKTCTATAVCKNDSTHKVTETAEYKADKETSKIKATVKETATTEKMGTTTYTASFENALFAAQTKDVVDIPKVENPAENPSENPSENPAENPSENPSENPAENPSENPSENPAENPSENPSQGGQDNPQQGNDSSQDNKKSEQTAADKPQEVVTDKPSEKTADTPATPVENKTTTVVKEEGTTIPVADNKAEVVVTSKSGEEPSVAYKGTTDESAKAIEIPETVVSNGVTYAVTEISDGAFEGNKTIESVKVPDSVTSIGENAFAGCTNLKTITLSKNITEISDGAFNGCKKLKSIKIPDSVTTIGEKAFNDCKKLNSMKLGKNVKKISPKAFSGAKKLKVITIKTKKLTKKSIKNALKGSSINTIKVNVGSKSQNKAFVKKYSKIFTKSNTGRKVKLK